jgi:hypothetical protein
MGLRGDSRSIEFSKSETGEPQDESMVVEAEEDELGEDFLKFRVKP